MVSAWYGMVVNGRLACGPLCRSAWLAGSKRDINSAWKLVWYAFVAQCCHPFVMLGPSWGCGSQGGLGLFMN